MSRAGRLAEVPAGGWTKWLVVGFWVAVLVITFPLSAKLTGAEKNDAKTWLPANAESTKVVDVQSRFQSPNVFPAVIVYERASGLTAADRAAAAADAIRFAALHGVAPGQVTGPVPSSDGKAMQTIVSVNLGKHAWDRAATAASSIRAITRSDPSSLASHVTGPLGYAADFSEVFKGIDSTLLYSTLVVVIIILLITYRSPVLWLLPVVSAGVALITAQAVIYLLAAHAGIPLILAVVLIILIILLRALVAPLILIATVVLSFAAALGVSAFFFTHVFGFAGTDTFFPLYVFLFLVALGIDYNIFLMTRVREEARRSDARHGAITGLAATGGVITSAGFVLAGTFAVLATIPFTFLTELGFAVAFGILLDTVIVRSVLVTALNLDLGRWMWWPSR